MTRTADDREGCVFCHALEDEAAATLIVAHGTTCFVLLNLYPYNAGHLMVVPRRHVGTLAELTTDELSEIGYWSRLSEMALTEGYRPQGINLGMNLGKSAGAGVLDHLHVHVVPRWNGDTNFMTVVGHVRVLPEELPQTATTLRPIFERLTRDDL